MKGALKSLPENLYWHYKMGRGHGVLEITLLFNQNKLMLNCKSNRLGKCVADAVKSLIRVLNLIETTLWEEP